MVGMLVPTSTTRPHRLMVRTSLFQGENGGSIPPGAATFRRSMLRRLRDPDILLRMKTARVQTYLAVFEEEEDGGYSVSVPALPGCFSQGDTFEEARKNIEEAIRLYLEDADEETKTYLRSRRGEVVTPVSV